MYSPKAKHVETFCSLAKAISRIYLCARRGQLSPGVQGGCLVHRGDGWVHADGVSLSKMPFQMFPEPLMQLGKFSAASHLNVSLYAL